MGTTSYCFHLDDIHHKGPLGVWSFPVGAGNDVWSDFSFSSNFIELSILDVVVN
jgi:hypothetical protein